MLEVWKLATGSIIPIVLFYVGFLERRFSMISHRANQGLKKDEVEHLVDLKQASVQVRQEEIKEDLHRIESKLDRLLEKLASK